MFSRHFEIARPIGENPCGTSPSPPTTTAPSPTTAVVDAPTLSALERLRAIGPQARAGHRPRARRLLEVFPERRPVRPRGGRERRRALRPATARSDAPGRAAARGVRRASCSERGVAPLSVGHVIVATWEPHEDARARGDPRPGARAAGDLQQGRGDGAALGVNKATGLAAALDELGLSPHNVVGVGDAENDHAFLPVCECARGGGQRAAGASRSAPTS